MERFLEVLREHLGPRRTLDERTPLLSSGLIGSFDLAEWLVRVEREYGVAIPVSEIGVDNFDTPEQMLELVRRLGEGR